MILIPGAEIESVGFTFVIVNLSYGAEKYNKNSESLRRTGFENSDIREARRKVAFLNIIRRKMQKTAKERKI